MDLTALIRAFVAAGLLPPSLDGSVAPAAPPLAAAEMAGPVSRDRDGLQDLTAAEMAGPVARADSAIPGATDAGLGGMMKILQALGLFTSDGNFDALGVLGAALNGAAVLSNGGRQAPPRIAPAWSPGGSGAPLGFVGMLPSRAPAVEPIPLPAMLRALIGG